MPRKRPQRAIAPQWERWLPTTRDALASVADAMGEQMANVLSGIIQEEIERFADSWSPTSERDLLVDKVMGIGADLHWEALATEVFEIPSGLENWSAFCGRASIGNLRLAASQGELRLLAKRGRKRLADNNV